MTLDSGTNLGPYRIVCPLGAGGMGEVYRAHDQRLGRDVALKVLPDSMARDAEGLARFTREARALAALNHPHIVTIFSTEDAQGVRFLTMELVEGRTLDHVLASVLAREPDLSSLPPDLAPRLPELLKRCLEKPPKRRWQAIGDVRHELEVIAQDPRKLEDTASGVALAAAALVKPKPLWRRALPVAAGALVAAAITAVAFIAARPGPPAPLPVQRFVIPYGEDRPRTINIRTAVAISPDGTHVAYVADRDIYVRALADLEPRRLDRGATATLASTPMNLVFSPDGKSLAYFDLGDARIKRLDLAGGPPGPVCAAPNPNGITWHGDYLYFTGPSGIRRVRAAGGDPEIIIRSEQPLFRTAPQVLDDGRLLYSVVPPGTEGVERWMAAKIVVQRPGETMATTLEQDEALDLLLS